MAAKTLILAHNNQFNRSVLDENAFYFSSTDELSRLFQQDLHINKPAFSLNNLKKIDKVYRWPFVVDKYEAYFEKILSISKK